MLIAPAAADAAYAALLSLDAIAAADAFVAARQVCRQ